MKNLPKKSRVKLSGEYKDRRGKILNICNQLFGSCALITSRKNSVRANHYHKKDWHYCYVIKGKIQYYSRKVGSKKVPKKEVFKTGDLIFTPPMVEHAFFFPINTIFITLGRGSRKRINYEKDTIRIKLI
tara:strand:+ start:1063 stop:1452 length:390 start_codon:yes stop_codon:yes gene_type:complete